MCQQADVTESSFNDPVCISVWRTASKLKGDRKIVDLVTLADAMGGDSAENMLALGELVSLCPSVAYAQHYVAQVAEAHRRRVYSDAVRMAAVQLQNGGTVVMVADALKTAGEAVVGGNDEPQIVSAKDFCGTPIAEPPQVIHGVIRAGQVGMMAASSKAGKSWALLSLANAVASGLDWLGWHTTRGRVLYINAELPKYDLERRLERIAAAMGLSGIPDLLDVWHLRGTSKTVAQLIPMVLRRQRNVEPYALILPDPLYSFGGGRDENSNSEQAKTMAELSELAERSGAAVWIAHHFSKGNKAMTDHLDRASGAGMYARAVDVFSTFTRHEQEDCYAVETTCRSFAKPEPFVVRWEYPLWQVAADLDPLALKQHPSHGGRPATFTAAQIVEILPNEGMRFADWQRAAEKSPGVKQSRFAELVKQAKAGRLVEQNAFGTYLRAGGGL